MRFNSLALPLFRPRPPPGRCWCCRSPASSSIASTATTCRRASTGSCRSSSTPSPSTAWAAATRRPIPPANLYEPLFEVTHSGWYWQITPLDEPGAAKLVSASLATATLPSPAANASRPTHRRALDERQGPARRALPPRRGHRHARPRARQAALLDHRRRPAGLARAPRRQFPQPADHGAGARRPRARRRDAVPGAVRAVAAAPDRARPRRHPLGRRQHARRRAAGRDRAAAVGAQRAHPLQPGHRRPGAHAGRQPGARAEDAARRHHQRGARRQDGARRQGRRAGADHARLR